MTINPNSTTAACSGGDDRRPLLMPDVVLQEARELHRYWLKENKPYSAGVVADCIATIENLQGRTTQASAPRSASAGDGVREALEPFVKFVSASAFKYFPDDFVLTTGSSMAMRQLTAGDFRKLLAALAAPEPSVTGGPVQRATEQSSTPIGHPAEE